MQITLHYIHAWDHEHTDLGFLPLAPAAVPRFDAADDGCMEVATGCA